MYRPTTTNPDTIHRWSSLDTASLLRKIGPFHGFQHGSSQVKLETRRLEQSLSKMSESRGNDIASLHTHLRAFN
jgi:hypothetical protein